MELYITFAALHVNSVPLISVQVANSRYGIVKRRSVLNNVQFNSTKYLSGLGTCLKGSFRKIQGSCCFGAGGPRSLIDIESLTNSLNISHANSFCIIKMVLQ